MKILLAPDSFKNSISSINVCKTLKKSIQKTIPQANIISIPVSDGGEGFIDILSNNIDLEIITKSVTGPTGKKVLAKYGVFDNTAYLELAQTSGIQLVKNEDRNPFNTTTYGFGELIMEAINKGIKKFVLGIGGSATNDGGAGMAQALGFNFFDKNENIIDNKLTGELIGKCIKVKRSYKTDILNQCEFLVACDVSNPLLGDTGAVYTYAKQKGATERDLPILEKNMMNFNQLFEKDLIKHVRYIEGSGASGGLGGGLVAFLNAQLVSGSKLILETLDFNNQIKNADYVITGEGKIDFQTKHGKIISAILEIAKKNNVPVLGICGILENPDQLSNDFKKIIQLTDFGSFDDCMMNPEKYIELAIKDLLKNFLY